MTQPRNLANLTRLFAAWNAGGLPSGPKTAIGEAARHLDRIAGFDTDRRAAEVSLRASLTEVAVLLADGTLSAAEAIERRADLDRRLAVVTDASGASLIREATDILVGRAYAHLEANIDKLHADIAAAHDAAIAPLLELPTGIFDGVSGAEAADRAGLRDEWRTAVSASRRRKKLIALAGKLRQNLQLRLPSAATDRDLGFRYPEHGSYRGPSGMAHLLHDIADGAEPTVATPDEVAATLARRAAENDPARAA